MGRIKLYRNMSNKNVVDKNFDEETGWINITFKDTVDVLNPIIRLTFNDLYLRKNYVYIEEFDRYYFIDKTELVEQTYICYCHVDVLQSYKNSLLFKGALKSQSAIASRSANKFDQYYTDNELQARNDNIVQTKIFNGFSFKKKLTSVLTVLGGD